MLQHLAVFRFPIIHIFQRSSHITIAQNAEQFRCEHYFHLTQYIAEDIADTPSTSTTAMHNTEAPTWENLHHFLAEFLRALDNDHEEQGQHRTRAPFLRKKVPDPGRKSHSPKK